MKNLLIILLSIILHAGQLFAAEKDADSEAYWDFGLGLGAVRLEHYPASNEFWTLAIPAPTFQYRGKILRADDRDGAHLYLYKGETVTLELAGEGTTGLNSSDSKARVGMPDLPWVAGLGAQLIYHDPDYELGTGIYQAFSTDFRSGRPAGNIAEAHATYIWRFPIAKTWPFAEDVHSTGKLNFSLKAATADNLALYFEVPVAYATPDRAAYEAKAGLLSRSISYYQSFKSGRVSLYLGASVKSYDISANRQSPLHKADHNLLAFLGFNYTLSESSRPAVPPEDTSGVLDGLRKRQLREGF